MVVRKATGAMDLIQLTCEEGETDTLLAELKGRVFHFTPSFSEIKQSGRVLNNKDGHLPINTSSNDSFGRNMGYVCLFDFRDRSEEELDAVHSNYAFLFPQHFEKAQNDWETFEAAYLILHPDYYDKLIPNDWGSKYNAENPFLDFIPKAEVWIKDHLPLEWIDTALLVTFHRRPVFDPLADALRTIYMPEAKPKS